MKNLESFLNAYRMNLEFFDLEVFNEDIMDIPYQIETLEKMYEKLSERQREEFAKLNKKLLDMINNTIPQDETQAKILNILKNSIAKEVSSGKIAA